MATISNPYTLTDYTMKQNLSSLGLKVNGVNDWSINGWCGSNLGIPQITKTAIFEFTLNELNLGDAHIQFEYITNIRYIFTVRNSNLECGKVYTCLINFSTGYFKVMVDGKYIDANKIGAGFSSGSSGDSWSNKWVISLGGTGRVKFDSLKYMVNLPDNTMMNYIENELYLKGNEIYGMNNGALVKLHSEWDSLSDAEKLSIFTSTNHETPTLPELSALGNFKILDLNETNYQPIHRVTAAPRNQLVLPKSMMLIDGFEGIDKVMLATNVSQNAKCKLLITTDLKIYQTYDFQLQQWKDVDHTTLIEVDKLGIDAAQLSNIPRTAWDALTKGKAGIGFAYLLSMEDTTDTCNIDKLELLVEMKGEWSKMDIK